MLSDELLLTFAKSMAVVAALIALGGIVGIVFVHRRIKKMEGEPLDAAKKKKEKATRSNGGLSEIAGREALRGFHGAVCGLSSNLQPLVSRFEGLTLERAENRWCAAFVYHCVRLYGLRLASCPPETEAGSFAACAAWENWGRKEKCYLARLDAGFDLKEGDIVLYDSVLEGKPCDHMGIVLSVDEENNCLRAAEGNVNNVSAIVQRSMDDHIRGRIRIG